MLEAHFCKLRARDDVTADEERAIRSLFAETRKVEAHTLLVREGQDLSYSILLLEGWLGRIKDSRKGKRQILELHVPGDFADLHGFTLKRLDHGVITLTQATIAIAPHDHIRELVDKHPHLARLYWFSTNMDAAIQRQWTFSISCLSAAARMAHLFCELFVRFQIIGRAKNDGFDLPLTQTQLAECLGLTNVHVNRTVQFLRSKDLIQLEDRHLTILDHARLQSLAEFDPDYLYLKREPR